jgi:hypothetical protein
MTRSIILESAERRPSRNDSFANIGVAGPIANYASLVRISPACDSLDFAARLTISEEQQARVRGILAKAGVG